jgi:sulfatase maturation enzyme AslB (radical SAM superfamily)
MSDWYCPLPFRHAYIDSTGIAACCQTQRYQVALDAWATHPELIKLQQELLAGNKPAVCKSCVRQEQIYGASLRTNSNRDYNNQVFTDTNLDFIDFRSVNICNFKCRSCNPLFSHGITQEINNYPELEKFFGTAPTSKIVTVTDGNVDWIIRNLKSLKRIMFTGGEPTLIPGVRNLINEIKLHHQEIMVMITSNASFQDDFWFEITEQLPNLHWTVSVDAVGPAAEIVRHGSDWAVIERNVSWLAQHAQSLDINSVVSNLTIFELKPLLEFGRNMQQLSITPIGRHGDRGCRHQFFVCQRPYWLAADNLSEELLHRAVPYLESCTTLDLDDEQRNMLDGLVSQIKSAKFDPQLWNKSQSYNQTLNQIRNEDHLTLYDTQKYKYLHAPQHKKRP